MHSGQHYDSGVNAEGEFEADEDEQLASLLTEPRLMLIPFDSLYAPSTSAIPVEVPSETSRFACEPGSTKAQQGGGQITDSGSLKVEDQTFSPCIQRGHAHAQVPDNLLQHGVGEAGNGATLCFENNYIAAGTNTNRVSTSKSGTSAARTDVAIARKDKTMARDDVSLTANDSMRSASLIEPWGEVPVVNETVHDPGVRGATAMYNNEEHLDDCEPEIDFGCPDQIYLLFKTLQEAIVYLRQALVAELKKETEKSNRLIHDLAASRDREKSFKEELQKASAENAELIRKGEGQNVHSGGHVYNQRKEIDDMRGSQTGLKSRITALEQQLAGLEVEKRIADDLVELLRNQYTEMAGRAQDEKEEMIKQAQKEKGEQDEKHEEKMVEIAQMKAAEQDKMLNLIKQLHLSLQRCEEEKRTLEKKHMTMEQLVVAYSDAQRDSEKEITRLHGLWSESQMESRKQVQSFLKREQQLRQVCESHMRVTKERVLRELEHLDVHKRVSKKFWKNLTSVTGQQIDQDNPSLGVHLVTAPDVAFAASNESQENSGLGLHLATAPDESQQNLTIFGHCGESSSSANPTPSSRMAKDDPTVKNADVGKGPDEEVEKIREHSPNY